MVEANMAYVSYCRLLKFMGFMMNAYGSELLSVLIAWGPVFQYNE